MITQLLRNKDAIKATLSSISKEAHQPCWIEQLETLLELCTTNCEQQTFCYCCPQNVPKRKSIYFSCFLTDATYTPEWL